MELQQGENILHTALEVALDYKVEIARKRLPPLYLFVSCCTSFCVCRKNLVSSYPLVCRLTAYDKFVYQGYERRRYPHRSCGIGTATDSVCHVTVVASDPRDRRKDQGLMTLTYMHTLCMYVALSCGKDNVSRYSSVLHSLRLRLLSACSSELTSALGLQAPEYFFSYFKYEDSAARISAFVAT